MQFAPILPVGSESFVRSDYYICFAELALEHATYADWFRRERERGAFVLMDVMTFEGTTPLSETEWHNAIKLVQPSVACALDVLDNAEATIERFRQLFRTWTHNRTYLMGVVQGYTEDDYLHCARTLLDYTPYLGMFVHHHDGTKVNRTKALHMLATHVDGFLDRAYIHLLGAATHDFSDVVPLKYCASIMGVDSAKPASAALRGYPIIGATPEQCKRPQDFFSVQPKVVSRQLPLLAANIATVVSWLNTHTTIQIRTNHD